MAHVNESHTPTRFSCVSPISLANFINRDLRIPFPTERLASTALQAISVDPELSGLVNRSFQVEPASAAEDSPDAAHILRVDYRATTNRMLRVAVNSFMESLRLVVEVMETLDSDVLTQNPIPAEKTV